MKKRLFIILIVILCLSISYAYAGGLTGYTNISDISIYKSNNYSSSVVDILKINSRVEILETKNEWFKVKTSDSKTGWIEKYFLTVPAEKSVVNNSGFIVNIRKGPTASSEMVGQLLPGESAKYIDTYHSWHIIEYKNSQYYIASWLTDLTSEGEEKIYLLYDNINIRSDISTESDIIEKGNKYQPYIVCGEKNGWLKLKLNDSKYGYVAGWLTTYGINYYSEGNSGYKTTTEDLNLRTGPSQKDAKIISLESSTPLKIISTEKGWDKVLTNNGQVGWCQNDYLVDIYPLSGKKILLDPGHGGKDPGSISYSGKYEKYVNLDVALKLKDKLEDLGAEVYLTRKGDTYINNTARGRMADSLCADILLSIHHNSLGRNKSDYFGLSTYYNTKNFKDPKYGYNLSESIYLNAISLNGVYRDGIYDRNYEVLRETNTPAALIEIGFMSNPLEEMNIHNESFQNLMVQKLADGIIDYFK